jgi:chaperone required for assembly of F1-ATPase
MKKFWKTVEVSELTTNSYQILLDKKILKTPMQNDLIFTDYRISYETSLEWDINSDELDTDEMIFFGIFSTAIDRIVNDRVLYINEIMKFVDTDLICYKADKPDELVELQNKHWDPILLIIKNYISEEIEVFTGIMPGTQNRQVHNKIKKLIHNFSNIELSILHRLTNIIGSIFISLCVLKGDILKKHVCQLCFLDELWQAENWGVEEEAAKKRDKVSKELKKIITLVNYLKEKD